MKKILITGSSGLVGTNLIKICLEKGYDIIGIDIKDNNEIFHKNYNFIKFDLTKTEKLDSIFNEFKFDAVLNCFGIKGSPIKAKTQPVDFLYPSLKANTEIINLSHKYNCWLVFISSVGVYSPSENFIEDDVWKTLPSENDWYPSWSKRIGELLLESYKVQYNYSKWSIIRPANIYGEYDDFSGNGTVISSMIKKVYEANDNIIAWGDGTPIRDFVYSTDVANAILELYERQLNITINFGSGEEITIGQMINNLIDISEKNIIVEWDKTKPNGDLRRQMNVTKQKEYGILPKINFYDGLKKTYDFYKNNKNK